MDRGAYLGTLELASQRAPSRGVAYYLAVTEADQLFGYAWRKTEIRTDELRAAATLALGLVVFRDGEKWYWGRDTGTRCGPFRSADAAWDDVFEMVQLSFGTSYLHRVACYSREGVIAVTPLDRSCDVLGWHVWCVRYRLLH